MSIEALVIENLAWLQSKARLFCSNRWDAEDLAGETIEKLLRSKSRFDSTRDFRPWALAIMRNTFITLYNRRMCVKFAQLGADYCYASPLTADCRLELREILNAIRRSARRSVAIECVLLYARGYNYQEIAERLDIPIGTVMSRISNGRKLLNQQL